jgi:hypothetical protein
VSIEALWSVEFISNTQIVGAGVAVLETDRIFGGDSQYFYVGDYKSERGVTTANIKVTHYAGAYASIFGPTKEFHLTLKGTPSRDQFELHGHVVGMRDLTISMRLSRRAELPE